MIKKEDLTFGKSFWKSEHLNSKSFSTSKEGGDFVGIQRFYIWKADVGPPLYVTKCKCYSSDKKEDLNFWSIILKKLKIKFKNFSTYLKRAGWLDAPYVFLFIQFVDLRINEARIEPVNTTYNCLDLGAVSSNVSIRLMIG